MQQIRKRPDLLLGLFTKPLALEQNRSCGWFEYGRSFEHREVEADRSEVLPRHIVEFPRNAPAFLVLNVQQAGGEFVQLMLGFYEASDVGYGAENLPGLPIGGSAENRRHALNPPILPILVAHPKYVLKDFSVPARCVLCPKLRERCEVVGVHESREEIRAHL